MHAHDDQIHGVALSRGEDALPGAPVIETGDHLAPGAIVRGDERVELAARLLFLEALERGEVRRTGGVDVFEIIMWASFSVAAGAGPD